MCNKCSKDGFHADVSFDGNVTSVKVQKDIRQKLMDHALEETVDIERWLGRPDAIIPREDQVITHMKGCLTRIGDWGVHYLEVKFYDPGLKRDVEQTAYIGKLPIKLIYENMKADPDIRSNLKLSDLKEGDIFQYTNYVLHGTKQPEGEHFTPGKFVLRSAATSKKETNVVPFPNKSNDIHESIEKLIKDMDDSAPQIRALQKLVISLALFAGLSTVAIIVLLI